MHRLPLLCAALMLTSVATPAWADIGSFEALESLIDRDQVRSVEQLIRALSAGACGNGADAECRDSCATVGAGCRTRRTLAGHPRRCTQRDRHLLDSAREFIGAARAHHRVQ